MPDPMHHKASGIKKKNPKKKFKKNLKKIKNYF